MPRELYWTPERISSAFCAWEQRHKRVPMPQDADVNPELPHRRSVRRFYATCDEAIYAAGLIPQPLPNRHVGAGANHPWRRTIYPVKFQH